MKTKDFDSLVVERCEKIKKLLSSKGKEYASEDERLHNFKAASAATGRTWEQALWGIYMKHWVSVQDMVEGALKPTKELIDEKIGDSINYHILLEALMLERLTEENKDKDI
jgi:hypothetical protein